MFERHLSCLGPSGFHRIVYSEWPGPPGAPSVLCVHGLTRNAKDFDAIAALNGNETVTLLPVDVD